MSGLGGGGGGGGEGRLEVMIQDITFFFVCFRMAVYFYFPSRTEDLTLNVHD